MKRSRHYALLGFFIGAGAVMLFWANLVSSNALTITFFDVGQGDAIFIETKQGHRILIDTGPDDAIAEKLAGVMPPGNKTLDALILTHFDKDHIGGTAAVLSRYEVGMILWSGGAKETGIAEGVRQAVAAEEQQGAVVYRAIAGQQIRWSGHDRVGLSVLYPDEAAYADKTLEENDRSIVAKLSYGILDILFTGDISSRIEHSLIANGVPLESEILKLAHHGSKNSNGKEFFRSVRPQLAIAQAGINNSYGHPHAEVLERLEEYAITVLGTHEKGDITVRITPDI